jgi:hypothetical protein
VLPEKHQKTGKRSRKIAFGIEKFIKTTALPGDGKKIFQQKTNY